MKTTLLIMAAGIGSRYGSGIKQLATVDASNHIIMDYSIHDAIEAGFNKIVFVIRKDIEEDFKDIIGKRVECLCKKLNVDVEYASQSLGDLPEGVYVPEGREKPWGTGQAVLAAKHIIHEPFAVINADDYYGKEAFIKVHDFLTRNARGNSLCMAGFILKNTLSDNGGVTRGICEVNEKGYLTDVVETQNIVKIVDGMNLQVMAGDKFVNPDACVSMNMWGLTPEFMQVLEVGFEEFLKTNVAHNPLKAEYLLPIYIGELLRKDKVSVKVLETSDKWFGVTYIEDKELVSQNFLLLVEAGVYQEDLYADLDILV